MGADVATAIDARYGRTPGRRRAQMWWGLSAAVAVAIAVIAWVVWVGLLGPGASIDTRDIGYTLHGNSSIDVVSEVSVAPGTPVSCAVQALNEKFAVVGWKVVSLPASETRTRQFTQPLRTSEQAVTGLIYRCWLT